jgi:hypothetical protein
MALSERDMARQSGRERRGDQGEKRQPYQHMIAPSPHRDVMRIGEPGYIESFHRDDDYNDRPWMRQETSGDYDPFKY